MFEIVKPMEIEARSFEIITELLGENQPDPETAPVEMCIRDRDKGIDGLEIRCQQNRCDSHHHFCSGGDTQNKRSGNGIAEKGLQQKSGHRQGASQNGCQKHPGHSDTKNDLTLRGCFRHRPKGIRTGKQIPEKGFYC